MQLTFGLLLELCLRVQRHSDAVASGRWASAADFCFWDYPLVATGNLSAYKNGNPVNVVNL